MAAVAGEHLRRETARSDRGRVTDEGVIELSLPRSRIDPDPDVDWVWEGGELQGSTADGAVTVSITRQCAWWSWNSYTLFAEELEDQVWLTFDEIATQDRLPVDPDAASEEVCPAWIGLAVSPARALVSMTTREKLSMSVNVWIRDRVFDVTSQAIGIFERSRENAPGRRTNTGETFE